MIKNLTRSFKGEIVACIRSDTDYCTLCDHHMQYTLCIDPSSDEQQYQLQFNNT